MTNTNVWTEDESSSFHRPTEEEYLQAREDMQNFARWARTSRERQSELIDELSLERDNEKTYTELYEKKKDICRMYEVCLKFEKNTKSKTRKKANETSDTDKHTT